MTLEQFTFDFYLRLRQCGLPLTIEEYKLLLDAIQKGVGIGSKDDFLETCQLLWGKSEMQMGFIGNEFQGYYQQVFVQIVGVQKGINPISDTGTEASSGPNTAFENTDIGGKSKHKSVSNITSPKDTELDKTFQGRNQSETAEATFTQQNAPVIAFYPNKDGGSPGEALSSQLYAVDANYIQSPFILNNDYLPVSLRQVQQSWRKLRYYTSATKNRQHIDWHQTIQETAQKGFFIQPTYKKSRQNQIHLTILIDHQGSMIPHWSLGQRLIEAAKKEGGYPDADIYYTHNVPSKYLYKDPHLTDSISIGEMIERLPSQHSVFLIFSDAGASRGLFNAQRAIATKRFVALLNKKVQSIAWLNPMPQSRWKDTSAEFIKLLAPMFECSEAGIEAAIKVLKTGRNARR